MKNILPLLTALVLYACSPSYTSYVNPMIGTGGHGHTYPGATVPNGMVQLSPDTRLVGWDACSGYPIDFGEHIANGQRIGIGTCGGADDRAGDDVTLIFDHMRKWSLAYVCPDAVELMQCR